MKMPKKWKMDETTPFENCRVLNPRPNKSIISEINNLKKGAIIIVVSHDEVVLSSCDVVYEINNGCINIDS